MTYIKKAHRVILQNVQGIVERRKDTLDETEIAQYEEFCGFMDDISSENEKITEESRNNMRKYRSTPEGKEKNRLMSQKYRELKKQNNK